MRISATHENKAAKRDSIRSKVFEEDGGGLEGEGETWGPPFPLPPPIFSGPYLYCPIVGRGGMDAAVSSG